MSEVMKVKYAVRVNSFLSDDTNLEEALKKIGAIEFLEYVDLNYPEHFEHHTVSEIKSMLDRSGLKLSSINMRFRREFLNGVFTNPNDSARKKAFDLCVTASEVCKELGGNHIVLWLSYDGYDYPFQSDYNKAWSSIRKSVKAICDAVDVKVSIEYKPYEERANTYMDSYASTLLMVKQVGCENLGVTIDVCHMLMKKECPAMAAALLLEEKKLFYVHLNDSECFSDDGLMIGSVHPFKLFELFYYLKKFSYDGIIYFDTFPKREKAELEASINIKICKKMERLVDTVGMERLNKIVQSQDAIAVMDMLSECIV